MSLMTLTERFASYEHDVMPQDAGAVQRRETCIAFFAGAKAMLDVTVELAGLPDAAAIVRLEQFHRELDRFAHLARSQDHEHIEGR